MSAPRGRWSRPLSIAREVERRRTFAIISHPDAGKTTHDREAPALRRCAARGRRGAGQESGAKHADQRLARAGEAARHLGQQLGDDTSSTRLRVNILDTPGHHDFSEDTYRTLTAADSAVMLIDAAKGVEPQTRKLFQVCRMRGIPIFTFVNKMDRLGRDPLDLMGEIEDVLGIHATPVNWPVGSGSDFRGVYDRLLGRRLLLFSRRRARAHRRSGGRGRSRARSNQHAVATATRARWRTKSLESLELLDGAGCVTTLDLERVRGRADTDVLRQRADQLRRAPLPRALSRDGALPARSAVRPGPIDPVEIAFSGIRLQDPGEHGSRSPRPRRLRAQSAPGLFAKGRDTSTCAPERNSASPTRRC